MQSSPIRLKVMDVTVLTALPVTLEVFCLNINSVCLGRVEKHYLLHVARVRMTLTSHQYLTSWAREKDGGFYVKANITLLELTTNRVFLVHVSMLGSVLHSQVAFLPYFSSTVLLQAYTPFINWAHSAGNTARLSSRTHLACNQ